MPRYLYTCEDCGAEMEEFSAIGDRKPRIRCDCGAMAGRDFEAEQRGTAHSPRTHGESWSLPHGCNPNQVEGRRKAMRQAGFAPHECEHDAGGRLRLTSREHQSRVNRWMGVVNPHND